MFGIEISSDILIIAIFVQMVIIAILIFTILTKLNRINPASASSSFKNTELDKKVDKKLTGMQIRLNEILSEISSATKEQKESISSLAATVTSAAAAAAAATNPSADEARTYDATACVLTTSNIFPPNTQNISSLTKMNQFASNANVDSAAATIDSTISINPSKFATELFDRSDDSSASKSEFLEIDIDHVQMKNPSKESDPRVSELQNAPEVVHTATNTHSDSIPGSIITSDCGSSQRDSVGPAGSRHYYHHHPQTHNHFNRRQYYDSVLPESSSLGNNADEMINGLRENGDTSSNNEDNTSQNQEFNNREDSDSEKLNISGEKNSNPELDKIDKEILIALQRLGGMSTSDNPENRNDSSSSNRDKME